ncbi:unnamed protein product [Blepharisma stoltei]|uniref:Uncharacterized protein n=1 Tax=Blepharisma stoltei TaxID=1481888 RepID=A0AAU9IR23_9CILI|nr:unnamed protein product [Blepharisma stoltei]
MSYDYLIKGMLIGDSQVGKSNLLLRYAENNFREEYNATIGVEFGTKIKNINELAIKFQLWDTSGQESFRSITRSYYRAVAAAFIVYDVTSRGSFEHLTNWVSEAMANAPRTVVAALVGNKIDREEERKVLFEEGQKFANDHQMIYLETSAKTGWNVDNVFNFVAAEILARIRNGQIDVEDASNGIKISRQK